MLRRIGSTPAAFLVSIIFAGSLGWLAGHAAEPEEENDDDRSPKELAQEEVKLADEAIRAAWEAFRAGRVDLAGARVDRWSLRRVESLRESGASHKKMIDAWKLHRDQMEALSKLAKSNYKEGRATLLDYLEAQYALNHAKRELAKTQADDKEGEDDDAEASGNQRDEKDDASDAGKRRERGSDESTDDRRDDQRNARGDRTDN